MQYQKPVIVQQQKMKLSPQMYQSIQMMALPLQELKFRIQEEIEQNPALEIIEDRSTVSIDAERQRESENQEEREYFENSSDPGFNGPLNYEASDNKRKFIEGVLTRPESLHEHLLWQLRLQPISPEEFRIGELLIQNLNESGFHREDPETLVKEEEIKLLQGMMEIIQGFDPVGTCTKDYREALLVQIMLTPEAPEHADEVVEHYLETLEKGKYSEISKKLKLEDGDIEEILKFIKTLNPYPGSQYSTESPQYVIPDLMVKLKEGEFVLILNDEEIPVLGIDPFFKELVRKKEKKPENELKQYVNRNLREAKWFIRSIKQRNETLLKIAKAIIEFQRDFFIKGPRYLIPLTLKDIAEEVSVHETTVSRIANAKYIQTEWGIFPLKYFFTNSISGTGSSGSRFSKEGVKHIIKELIESHKETTKLSDQKIADLLKKQGIQLARRTVAKYRKELDILSSYGR